MRIVIPVLFLSLICVLLCPSIQSALRRHLTARPALVFLVPLILSGLFSGIAMGLGALTAPLTALILVYTFAPTACAFVARHTQPPGWADAAVILLLWLPLELAVGREVTPGPVQGLLHTAAYGVAVTLALVLLLLFRRLDGMKYKAPTSARDFVNPLIGFVAVAPVLILVGRVIGFLDPFHLPDRLSPTTLAVQFIAILAATALPEEILFRGLIQNCLMQRLGRKTSTLMIAALIFGCSHLNNGPGPLPNWRYAIVATIAGFAYGKVFEKSDSIFASAFLHALVNTAKHNFW